MARLVAYGIGAVEPGHVRPRTRSGRAAGARARRLEDRRLERIEINEAFAAIALAVTKDSAYPRNRQCRGRRHRAWPSDRRDRRRADDAPAALDAARRHQPGIVTLCIGGGRASRWRSESGK